MFLVLDHDGSHNYADGPATVTYDDGLVTIKIGQLTVTLPEYDARSLDIMLGMAYGVSIGGNDE